MIKVESMDDLLYWYKAKIHRVIDGDTVVFSDIDLGFSVALTGKHGRLLGINAPEIHSKDAETRLKAMASRDYLLSRLTGQEVYLRSRSIDSFGRILCDIYLNDEHINESIKANGFAVEFMVKSN